MHIVGIGNPVFDSIKGPDRDSDERILSGCSTNVCLASAKLGLQTTFVGRVGDDYQAELRSILEQYGIDARLESSEETGGFALVYLDELGNRTLDCIAKADPIEYAPADILQQADFVMLGPILEEVSLALVESIRPHARRILLDPQGVIRRIDEQGRIDHYRNPEIDAIIQLCDVVKANELEAEIITGIRPRDNEESLRKATIQLHELGADIAVVTMATDGSAAFDGETYVRVPAYTANQGQHPTGVGDTYATGFMYAFLTYNNLADACLYGGCTSSVMAEHVGPHFPLTQQEADRRFNELKSQYLSALAT